MFRNSFVTLFFLVVAVFFSAQGCTTTINIINHGDGTTSTFYGKRNKMNIPPTIKAFYAVFHPVWHTKDDRNDMACKHAAVLLDRATMIKDHPRLSKRFEKINEWKQATAMLEKSGMELRRSCDNKKSQATAQSLEAMHKSIGKIKYIMKKVSKSKGCLKCEKKFKSKCLDCKKKSKQCLKCEKKFKSM